jgi:hypothetical protein
LGAPPLAPGHARNLAARLLPLCDPRAPRTRSPLPQHAQHAALTGTGLLLAALSRRPAAYRRWRLGLIPAARLLLMSMPIARSASVRAPGAAPGGGEPGAGGRRRARGRVQRLRKPWPAPAQLAQWAMRQGCSNPTLPPAHLPPSACPPTRASARTWRLA